MATKHMAYEATDLQVIAESHNYVAYTSKVLRYTIFFWTDLKQQQKGNYTKRAHRWTNITPQAALLQREITHGI